MGRISGGIRSQGPIKRGRQPGPPGLQPRPTREARHPAAGAGENISQPQTRLTCEGGSCAGDPATAASQRDCGVPAHDPTPACRSAGAGAGPRAAAPGIETRERSAAMGGSCPGGLLSTKDRTRRCCPAAEGALRSSSLQSLTLLLQLAASPASLPTARRRLTAFQHDLVINQLHFVTAR